MAYTDQATALAAIKQMPAVRGLPVDADDAFLNQLLGASSALVGPAGGSEGDTSYTSGTRIYRHYYVAGRFLENARSQQTLAKAGDNVFTGFAKTIASLMELQAGQDKALNLLVPAGYESNIAEEDGSGTEQKRHGILIGSMSFGSKLTP